MLGGKYYAVFSTTNVPGNISFGGQSLHNRNAPRTGRFAPMTVMRGRGIRHPKALSSLSPGFAPGALIRTQVNTGLQSTGRKAP